MNLPSPSSRDSTPPPPQEESRSTSGLARGLIYRFIAAAYRHPEPDTLSAIQGQEQAISEALAVLSDSSDGRLAEWFRDLLNAARESTPDVLERDYTSLLGHVVQGRCPPYETEYNEGDERLQQPHELSDLSAFYRAFGLKLGDKIHERVDFIAVECEFAAFLCCKQAYAEERGDSALAEITVNAQRKFLRNHLGRWAPAFSRRIIKQSEESFYLSLAHFTLAYVTDDCKRVSVTPGMEHLKLRLPLKEADACMSCPMSETGAEANSGLDSPLKV